MQSLQRGSARAGHLVDGVSPLVDRGRQTAESLAREAAERVPSRSRRRRRRRGMIAVALLAIVGAVALYLAWQRRDHEPARLSSEPSGPDVAPPPMPDPPSPPSEETQSESAVAAVADPATVSPQTQPLTAEAELHLPSAVAPIREEAAEPGADEPMPEFDELVEADEVAEYPVADLSEAQPVEVAESEPVTEPVNEAEGEPAPAERAVPASRESGWFSRRVNETSQPEPPDAAPEVERSTPHHSPLRGANPLPPSGPAGAPFRPAGDALPGGRSWPTLPS